jgi:mannose-1-phosphate guanylyltransferase
MSKEQQQFAIIMAGGIGSRFWPLSRTTMPKQFLDFLGTGKSLLQMTYDRFKKFIPEEHIYIVTNKDYRSLVQKQIPNLPSNNILGEPLARNTAPCIAYATFKIADQYESGTCIVAPSDHLILDDENFQNQVNKGVQFAHDEDAIVTLGIQPSRPDTGYGYIQFVETDAAIKPVKTFTEKPDLALAKSFVASGDFLWNSGMFIWNLSTIKKAFSEYMPEMEDVFRQGLGAYNTKLESDFVENAYSSVNAISIDYGLIEKAENVYVIPSDFGWSDLGTWKSVYEHSDKDENGNARIGSLPHLTDSSNNLIASDNADKLIVLEGVEGLYIVDTKDALLICHRDKEQEVKRIVGEVKKKFNGDYN